MKQATKLLATLGLIAPLTLQAQDRHAPLDQIPQISVAGRGEVKISPDRATIQVSVQTRAPSAAAAAAENANKQQSVMTVLRSLGLGNDQLSTINYNVYPEQHYEQGKEPMIVAYNVTNTILVDVRKLSQVGPKKPGLTRRPLHALHTDLSGHFSGLISGLIPLLHLGP